MKRFSDFAQEESPLEGEKARIDTILNEEIAIKAFSVKSSKYSKNNSGKYLTIQFEIKNEIKIVFTGSDVLINQMEKYKEHIPFLATIKKINRYYTLT